MGYGFPAAIGAQVACPDRMVFDIAGDGSIQMNIQEMATAVANNVTGQDRHLKQRLSGNGPAMCRSCFMTGAMPRRPEREP